MFRKILWAAGVLVLLMFVGLAAWFAFGGSVIRLSQETIREMVAKQLPKESKGVTVDKGDVSFEGDQVLLKLAMHGEKFGQTFVLEASAVGKPRYEAAGGEFFFTPTDVKVTAFTLNEGTSIADRLKSAADRYLPEWKGGENLAEDVGKKLDGWVTTAAEQGAIFALKQMPVYRLSDDMKGIAAQAVLDKVAIEQNELVITFTIWRLTWWVLTFVGAFVLAIGFLVVLARNPSLGAAALTLGMFGGD